MSCEHSQTNGTRIGEVNTENLMKNHELLHPSRRTAFIENGFDCSRLMKGRHLINGRDHMSFD